MQRAVRALRIFFFGVTLGACSGESKDETIPPELCTSFCQGLVGKGCADGPTAAGCFDGCRGHKECIPQLIAEYECIVADDAALVCESDGPYLLPDHCVPEQMAATDCKYYGQKSAVLSARGKNATRVVP
jgi:hypothetical protein